MSKARHRLTAAALGTLALFAMLGLAELGLRFFKNTWGPHYEARISFSAALLKEEISTSEISHTFLKKLAIGTHRAVWFPGPTKLISQGHYTDYNNRIGFYPRPSASGSVRREDLSGRLIYDVEYRFDSHSRRETHSGVKNLRPALFLGCSCTLGEGVNADQNFAAVFGRHQSVYRPLVQAFHAWGPGNLLNLTQEPNFASDLSSDPKISKDGIAIYTYIDHHLNRTIGTSDLALGPRWYDSAFAFSTEDNKTLLNEGPMSRAWPKQVWFYRKYEHLLKASLLAGMTLPELPVIQGQHFDLLALVIDELGQKVRTRTGLGRFVVVVFPGSTTARWITPRLKARGIEVFDYSKLNLSDYADPAFIRLDGHPSKESHEVLGQLLAHDLLVPTLSE